MGRVFPTCKEMVVGSIVLTHCFRETGKLKRPRGQKETFTKCQQKNHIQITLDRFRGENALT